MAKNKAVERDILIDEPSSQDDFHGKGHERTANALVRAILRFEGNDRAIGLDGPWGSGKSTVVEIAKRKLTANQTTSGNRYHFFTFDIWQSQGASFRRSFLEHFIDWTRAEFPARDVTLEEIEHKVKGKVREVHSNNHSILDWWGVIVVVLIPILPLFYIWAKAAFDAAEKNRLAFLSSWPSIAMILFVIAPFALAAIRSRIELSSAWRRGWVPFFSKYREAVSRTLLINAKQYEDQKVTQYIRETDPNDFEFQSTLREILGVVQSEGSRVIFVLDNIDRLPRKEINDYWAQVRAVFANGPLVRSGKSSPVTAIVPYDRRLIEEGTRDGGAMDAGASERVASISSLAQREIFSKTFDEILSVSPPVMSNTRDFFISKISKALPGAAASDDLFRVFLIFDRILKSESGNATPRQIIAFINELTGMYVLHQARFGLPTVALYIAYQDSLEANPHLLNDRGMIDERLRTLAADEELDRNLAAMIFNVEPDLAFQLLLDNKIKQAAVTNADALLEVSKAPGFDHRVYDVVLNNLREWQSSSEFENVVANFADLAQQYSGDAKRHFSRTLVSAFDNLATVDISRGRESECLRAYDLATSEEHLSLTRNLLRVGFASFKDKELTLEQGGDWASYVGKLNRRLMQAGSASILEQAMAATSLPPSPAFMLGAAGTAANEGLDFKIFKPRAPQPTEDDVFSTLALATPNLALKAFHEFKRCGLFTDNQWLALGSGMLSSLEERAEGDDNYGARINILARAILYLPASRRGELDIESLFARSQFYEGLFSSAESTDAGLSSALFLAINSFNARSLPAPTKRGPNGSRVQDATDEFEQFRQRFDGEVALSDGEYEAIGTMAKSAFVINAWLSSAVENDDDPLLHEVLRRAFVEGTLPHCNLSTLMKHYGYLKRALQGDFVPMLERYQIRVGQKELDDLILIDIPGGLLSDTKAINGGKWDQFHKKVGALLNELAVADWKTRFVEADGVARLLLEKVSASGFQFSDPDFRHQLAQFYLSVMSGQTPISESFAYDDLIATVDARFHPDIYRMLRDEMKGVTGSSLALATKAFPQTVSNVVQSGERLTRAEKDNMVRFLLCSALEANDTRVLSAFEHLGRAKVRELIKSSEESTREKLEGAWATFDKISADFSWKRSVGELIHGRKRARSLFEIFLGTSAKTEEDEDA